MVDEINIEELLNKESNSSILKLNNTKIKQIKNDILQKLHFKPNIIKLLLKKLKNYRFVDDLNDIHFGRYIRWINIKKYDNLKLTNGGIICDIKMVNDGILITCKNNINKLFSIKMDENLIFQKLNDDEILLLQVMDQLNN
jgi:hypothetical protein